MGVGVKSRIINVKEAAVTIASLWEQLNNPGFNSPELEKIKSEVGLEYGHGSEKSYMTRKG